MEWISYNRLFVKNHIGKGGFGTVNLASWLDGPIISWNDKYQKWNRKPCYPVALKVLNNSKESIKNLLKEAKMYTQIFDNTFFIQCLGFSQDPKGDYIMVMELASLGSLYTYLNNTIPWKNRLNVLLNISEGLYFLHRSNLIHRDFHPGNLLLTSRNCMLITDLGLCKPANEDSQSNNIYGVMPYVTPEVLKGKPYTSAADIYSFGMVMYFVATGKQPFANFAHDQDLVLSICNGIRPEITVKEAPMCYIDLVKKCWDPNPDNRPNADEINSLIRSFKYKEIKKFEETPIGNNQLTAHPQAFYTSQLLNPYTTNIINIDWNDQ